MPHECSQLPLNTEIYWPFYPSEKNNSEKRNQWQVFIFKLGKIHCHTSPNKHVTHVRPLSAKMTNIHLICHLQFIDGNILKVFFCVGSFWCLTIFHQVLCWFGVLNLNLRNVLICSHLHLVSLVVSGADEFEV